MLRDFFTLTYRHRINARAPGARNKSKQTFQFSRMDKIISLLKLFNHRVCEDWQWKEIKTLTDLLRDKGWQTLTMSPTRTTSEIY